MMNLLRLLIGVAGVGLIVKFTPILDLLYLFFMIVCIPLMLMLSIGMITANTFNLITQQGNDFFATMKERVNHYRETENLSGGGKEVSA